LLQWYCFMTNVRHAIALPLLQPSSAERQPRLQPVRRPLTRSLRRPAFSHRRICVPSSGAQALPSHTWKIHFSVQRVQFFFRWTELREDEMAVPAARHFAMGNSCTRRTKCIRGQRAALRIDIHRYIVSTTQLQACIMGSAPPHVFSRQRTSARCPGPSAASA
jgi:hypothetical protein